ncbi:HAD family hydrolase [Sulfidibacter corallicola]|uniref:phosphoglycolate phosphatase n=1 Tax=Sulfidibacter corallicola TaxID=2818388 RepID=A0A8A4TR40_SULCO|nr:HAD family hydrolase [Sulfidibacter corallicola]QTD52439.1 HAD family hydrolase [Sulfidibacter corallicola]
MVSGSAPKSFPLPENASERFDLIVFDLDDTLLDTWGQLVRPAAREACVAMIEAGLDGGLEDVIRVRERLFRDDPRGDLYGRLARHFGIRDANRHRAETVSRAGSRAYFDREVEPHIRPFEGVVALLTECHRRFELHLVTSGTPSTQRRKVEILEFEAFFQEIHFVNSPEGETKRDRLAAILERSAVRPERAFCVGDRPDREIRDGNQLGMTTCRVHYGEFQHLTPLHPLEHADHVVDHVCEIRPILE